MSYCPLYVEGDRAMVRSLVGVRRLLSIRGRLIVPLGLLVAQPQKAPPAARRLHSHLSMSIVASAAAGKTTLFRYVYHSYCDVRHLGTRVNLRVLLLLLNKFDRWRRTTASREAMIEHYRTEVFPELVHWFRSRFG